MLPLKFALFWESLAVYNEAQCDFYAWKTLDRFYLYVLDAVHEIFLSIEMSQTWLVNWFWYLLPCFPANIRVHEFFKTPYFKTGIWPIPGAQSTLLKLSRFCHLSVVTYVQLHWIILIRYQFLPIYNELISSELILGLDKTQSKNTRLSGSRNTTRGCFRRFTLETTLL